MHIGHQFLIVEGIRLTVAVIGQQHFSHCCQAAYLLLVLYHSVAPVCGHILYHHLYLVHIGKERLGEHRSKRRIGLAAHLVVRTAIACVSDVLFFIYLIVKKLA